MRRKHALDCRYMARSLSQSSSTPIFIEMDPRWACFPKIPFCAAHKSAASGSIAAISTRVGDQAETVIPFHTVAGMGNSFLDVPIYLFGSSIASGNEIAGQSSGHAVLPRAIQASEDCTLINNRRNSWQKKLRLPAQRAKGKFIRSWRNIRRGN